MDTENKKIKIGIALGGGMARGFAHIGILKVLIDNGIKPDYIAGTSVGAVIGGVYAVNEDIYEAEKHAMSLDRKRLRSIMSISHFPAGIVQGKKLEKYISEMVGSRLFSDLKVPLRVTAVDLNSGDEIVIHRGDVAKAIRASCAFPSIFPPVKYGDTLLVDGGVKNPVPSDIVRDMGADMVIAINLSQVEQRAYTPKVNFIRNFSRNLDIVQHLLASYRKGHADIILTPSFGQLSGFAFDKADVFIKIGEEIAKENLVKIREKYEQIKVKKQDQLPNL